MFIPIRPKTMFFFLLNVGNRLLKKVFNSSIWGREEDMGWEERHKGRSVGSETGAGLAPLVITVAKQTNFCSWLSRNPAEPFCLVGSQL